MHWWLVVASSVADERIYMEEPPRVTTSHNRLGLSIKHILDTTGKQYMFLGVCIFLST
jgi:hypothetical protein